MLHLFGLRHNMVQLKTCKITMFPDILKIDKEIEDFKTAVKPGQFDDKVADKLFVSARLIAKYPKGDVFTTVSTKLFEKQLVVLKPKPPKQGTAASDAATRDDEVALNQSLEDMLKSNDIPANVRKNQRGTLCNFLHRVGSHHICLWDNLTMIKLAVRGGLTDVQSETFTKIDVTMTGSCYQISSLEKNSWPWWNYQRLTSKINGSTTCNK